MPNLLLDTVRLKGIAWTDTKTEVQMQVGGGNRKKKVRSRDRILVAKYLFHSFDEV